MDVFHFYILFLILFNFLTFHDTPYNSEVKISLMLDYLYLCVQILRYYLTSVKVTVFYMFPIMTFTDSLSSIIKINSQGFLRKILKIFN